MHSYTIRPPSPPEMDLIRLWLPLAFDCPGSICGLVAVDDLTGALCGAATMNALVDRAGRQIGGLLVFVPPERRRQGIGSALVRAMYCVAQETEMSQVATLDLVDAQDEACLFLHAVGMAPIDSLTVYETTMEVILPFLEPRYQQLPPTEGPRLEDFLPLRHLNPAEVMRFVQEHSEVRIGTTQAKLTANHYCLDCGGALMRGDRMVALALGRRDQDLASIDLLLVAQPSRCTAAELVLLLALAHRAQARGVHRIVFEADHSLHVPTVRLAARLGARELSTRHTYAIDSEGFCQ